ncbi:MAG: glycosyltransferase family protein [Magnetococcales bacterium]|nr:glycosyltransferase family protein [Magnetococcales bacterium]
MPNSSTDQLHNEMKIAIDLQKKGQDVEATVLLNTIITQFSGHSRPYFHLGMSLFNMERHSEAIDQISRAIAISPGEAEYHTFLGTILAAIGKKNVAKIRWQEAVRLDPKHAEALFLLGDALIDEGKPEEAIGFLQKALTAKPEFIAALNNKGLCHKALKQLKQAKSCFEKAIKLDKTNPDAHINLAMTLMIMGSYSEGWQEYEWRFKRLPSPLVDQPPDGVKLWSGESLHNKKFLVIAEQGYGDSLQFVRFISILKNKGAEITLLTQEPLAPLLKEMPEIDHTTTEKSNLGHIDYYCPLISIANILKTSLDSIPNNIPYITANQLMRKRWQLKLAPAPIRVGLVWEGKPLFKNDPLRRRSVKLEDFAPLAQIDGLLLFSLQKGQPAEQIESQKQMKIIDLDPDIDNFADTAAIISNLDIVITIDTATAHLTGALGKTAWILLPFSPDWRWGLDQDTTPWYPNSVLFRQSQYNQWQEPIKQMVELLKKWQKK